MERGRRGDGGEGERGGDMTEADREIVADALHRYFQSVWAAGGAGRAVIESVVGSALSPDAEGATSEGENR